MSAASENLKSNQRQLDMDGCEVGVSRQAIDETLEQYDDMLTALTLALKRLGELNRDDEAGIRIVLANAIDKARASTNGVRVMPSIDDRVEDYGQ